MLESPAVQEDKNVEENIAKNVRNLLRLKKEQHYTTIKDINNFFRLEKETKAINNRKPRDIKNLFHHEEHEFCNTPVKISNVGVIIILNVKVIYKKSNKIR